MRKANKYDIVVMTTAITRPDLHSIVFPAAIKTLEGLSCKWLINIDQVQNKSITQTAKNLNNMLYGSGIDVEFLYTSEQGGTGNAFFNAVRNLMVHGKQYKPNLGYYWLEDDWLSIDDFKLIDVISGVDISSDKWCISLADRDHMSFNPSIWSIKTFNELGYSNITTIPPDTYNLNPEKTCCSVGSDRFESTRKLDVFYTYKLMKDIGRKWQQENINGKRTFQINKI